MNLPGPPLGLFPGWSESASTAAVRVDHLTLALLGVSGLLVAVLGLLNL